MKIKKEINTTKKRNLWWRNNSLALSDLEEMKLDDISVNDYLLMTDIDKKESKKIKVQTLLDLIKIKYNI